MRAAPRSRDPAHEGRLPSRAGAGRGITLPRPRVAAQPCDPGKPRHPRRCEQPGERRQPLAQRSARQRRRVCGPHAIGPDCGHQRRETGPAAQGMDRAIAMTPSVSGRGSERCAPAPPDRPGALPSTRRQRPRRQPAPSARARPRRARRSGPIRAASAPWSGPSPDAPPPERGDGDRGRPPHSDETRGPDDGEMGCHRGEACLVRRHPAGLEHVIRGQTGHAQGGECLDPARARDMRGHNMSVLGALCPWWRPARPAVPIRAHGRMPRPARSAARPSPAAPTCSDRPHRARPRAG